MLLGVSEQARGFMRASEPRYRLLLHGSEIKIPRDQRVPAHAPKGMKREVGLKKWVAGVICAQLLRGQQQHSPRDIDHRTLALLFFSELLQLFALEWSRGKLG